MPDDANVAQATVRLRSAVLCDNVRSEDNGKRLLIGVYDAGVTINVVPMPLSLTLYGVFEISGSGGKTVEFKITAPAFAGQGRVVVPSDAPSDVSAPFLAPFVCIVEQESDIRLEWKIDGGPWVGEMRWTLELASAVRRLDSASAEQVRTAVAASQQSAQQAQAAQQQEGAQ